MHMMKNVAEISRKQLQELKKKMEENMGINHKLFHLGNDIVRLQQEIEGKIKEPYDTWAEQAYKEFFLEMLRIVNVIRQEYQNFHQNQNNHKQWWSFNILCSEEEKMAIQEQIEALELCYELLKTKEIKNE
jgi:hypothetical protein